MSSLIEVKHLKKYYNKGEIKALDDVSVNIERGDVMVVIGPPSAPPAGSKTAAASTCRSRTGR